MIKGRIHFPKNPWPRGHGIAKLAWTGRLDDRGLWFDLHLESASYDADDPPAADEEEEEDDDGDWLSKGVWTNYNRCALSSTKWGGQGGFLVGTAEAPFDPDRLSAARYRVDPLPAGAAAVKDLERRGGGSGEDEEDDEDARPFGIYLLGHDTAADHRLRFRPGPRGTAIDWDGRIALTYAGQKAFRYKFSARIEDARFEGFQIAPNLPPAIAADLLQVFTTAPGRFRRAGTRFVPTRLR